MEKNRQQYEYTFVRIGEGWLSEKIEGERDYQEIIHQHARDGWRLVQVFSPTGDGKQEYYELIFERAISLSSISI
jgi:hypothetical protein